MGEIKEINHQEADAIICNPLKADPGLFLHKDGISMLELIIRPMMLGLKTLQLEKNVRIGWLEKTLMNDVEAMIWLL